MAAPPVVADGHLTIAMTVTDDRSTAIVVGATVLVRDASGRVVTVGHGDYCLADATGCNPHLAPGATGSLTLVADVPTGFDAATATLDIRVVAVERT